MTRRRLRLTAALRVIFGATLVCANAVAQTRGTAPPEFDVASIKPSADPGDRSLVQAVPGRLFMQSFSARALIFFAYGVADYQVLGGPSWVASDHYDLQAKAVDSTTTVQRMEGPMLQLLLAGRFNLSLHHETKQLPVYELTLGNGSGKLQPSKRENCISYSVDSPPPPAPAPGQPRPVYCGFPRLASNGLKRTLDGAGIDIAALGGSLSRSQLHQPVVDKTGLSGTFDIHLEWTVDTSNAAGDSDQSDGPSIFTALREQVGLKLESTRGPVDVIVIDHIEKPSAN